MTWPGAASTEIVLLTERERLEPMRALVDHLQRQGFSLHILSALDARTLGKIPTAHVALVDVSAREYLTVGDVPPAMSAAWGDGIPYILVGRPEELARVRFSPVIHDFLGLPANAAELDTRLRFALWKTQGEREEDDGITLGEMRMNFATYEVFVEERKAELTYKEFELLKFFATHRRRVFTRPELLEQVWESDYYGGTRTVDVHIRRLRAKLGPRVGDMIQTVRNVGYRFG